MFLLSIFIGEFSDIHHWLSEAAAGL